MTEYRWSEIYNRGTELFHEPPTGKLETDIIAAFKINPARVKTELEKIGTQINAGAEIRSGWAILRKRLETVSDDLVVKDTGSHQKRLIAARRWIHNAGCHFDREDQVMDELFAQQGLLHELDTPALRTEILDAWHNERPRGSRAEREHADYMARIKAQRKEPTCRKTTPTSPGEPAPPTPQPKPSASTTTSTTTSTQPN